MVIGNEADHFEVCSDCQSKLDYGVQMSNAGYYIGTVCPLCGPYGRESDYFRTREAAQTELELWDEGVKPSARTPGFWGGPEAPLVVVDIAITADFAATLEQASRDLRGDD